VKTTKEIIEKGRKIAKCIYVACDESVAADVSSCITDLINALEPETKRAAIAERERDTYLQMLRSGEQASCETCEHESKREECDECQLCINSGGESPSWALSDYLQLGSNE